MRDDSPETRLSSFIFNRFERMCIIFFSQYRSESLWSIRKMILSLSLSLLARLPVDSRIWLCQSMIDESNRSKEKNKSRDRRQWSAVIRSIWHLIMTRQIFDRISPTTTTTTTRRFLPWRYTWKSPTELSFLLVLSFSTRKKMNIYLCETFSDVICFRRHFRKSTTCDISSEENFSSDLSQDSARTTPMNRTRQTGLRRFSLVKLEASASDPNTLANGKTSASSLVSSSLFERAFPDENRTSLMSNSPNLIQKLLFRQFSPKTRPCSMAMAVRLFARADSGRHAVVLSFI